MLITIAIIIILGKGRVGVLKADPCIWVGAVEVPRPVIFPFVICGVWGGQPGSAQGADRFVYD